MAAKNDGKLIFANVAGTLCRYPAVQSFGKIALSYSISEINALLRFMQKYKMAAKSCQKAIFCKKSPVEPAGPKFRRNRSILHHFQDKCVFAFYIEIQDGW